MFGRQFPLRAVARGPPHRCAGHARMWQVARDLASSVEPINRLARILAEGY
jgi:hypothetical protein